MWSPTDHTDHENLQWAWLRAVEWGDWPIFISQPVAPIVLLFFPWWSVIIVVIVINVTWSLFVRYNVVITSLAFWGAIFCSIEVDFLPVRHDIFSGATVREGTAALALFWPLVILVAPRASTQIGVIQTMFMQCLGYNQRIV